MDLKNLQIFVNKPQGFVNKPQGKYCCRQGPVELSRTSSGPIQIGPSMDVFFKPIKLYKTNIWPINALTKDF